MDSDAAGSCHRFRETGEEHRSAGTRCLVGLGRHKAARNYLVIRAASILRLRHKKGAAKQLPRSISHARAVRAGRTSAILVLKIESDFM